jgi:ribosomal protein S18 acetylase RimI-like enzyme
MMTIIQEVTTKKQLKNFIHFPKDLYKNHPYYIPSLRANEIKTFYPEHNPAFEFCESKQWLAIQNYKIVGRIAGIINTNYNQKTNKAYARFGWLDFIEDLSVLKMLIETVENWAKERQMQFLHGPLGFTSFDASGVLVEGFDELPTSFGHYNYAYYDEMLKQLGFEKEIDWIEFRIQVPESIPENVVRFSEIIKNRYEIKEVEFKSKKDILNYTDGFLKILNKSYGHLFAFSELTEKQKENLKKEYFTILQTKYVCFLIDKNNKLVGFGITTPSMAKAIQKSKGKLFPFGFLRIFRSLKKNNTAELLLIGVDKEYQNKGLTAIIFNKITDSFIKNGIKYVETTRELEENNNVQQLWSKYEFRQHKRARCYIKGI